MNKVDELKNQINWPLVTTLVVAAVLVAVVFWGMGKSGVKVVKEIAKAK